MLRKRDIELIAGLVEGTLEDESEARALVEQSSEAKSEFEAQRVAYRALRGASRVQMTDSERAELRRELWTDLTTTPTEPERRIPWYYKLAPVAAALFVMVGLAAVLTQSDNDSAGSTAEISSGLDGAASDTTQADSADTTSAASNLARESDEAEMDAVPESGDSDDQARALLAMPAAQFYETVAESVRSGDFTDTTSAQNDPAEAEIADQEACLNTSGLEDHTILGQARNVRPTDGDDPTSYLVVVPADEEIGPDTPVSFVDTETCELVHVEA